MNFDKQVSKIVITCNKRLSTFLKMEVELLGLKPARVFQTGVELRGTLNDCIKLNLHLNCASQVLYSLREFKVNSPDELYKKLITIPWEKIIPNEGYFSVTSNANHPSINNTMFVNVKIKDAVVDRMREQVGHRPDSGPNLDKSVVHVYWKDADAEVFVDTAGETLAKHGYRKIPGKAPMLEALATATILATKWDRKTPFINPMCGSGTVAIEAALLASNRKPGLLRKNYGFMHLLGYDSSVYQKELDAIKTLVKDPSNLKIVATDNNTDAVKISRINAQLAGVEKFIDFEVCDFTDTKFPANGEGILFFNPEYGERMGEISVLEETYKRIGDFMKTRCQGYTGYIFTGNLDLAKKIGLKASKRIEFYSAKLDCRLLEYELYAGSKQEASVPDNPSLRT
jgi:putative N6-adenine-specific DNA methylase